MKFTSINLIFFSPTNNTKKIVQSIAKGTGISSVKEIDLTYCVKKAEEKIEIENQLVIIGAPVYRGRISEDALERLKIIKAKNSFAIVVAIYGNRGYDDALLELKDLVQTIGFEVFSAAAFIGEHSFSNENNKIAHARPDNKDLNFAENFGKQSYDKIMSSNEINVNENLNIPGNFPYKLNDKMPIFLLHTNDESCSLCGRCVEVCPVDAVSLNNKIITDNTKCILCSACIKNCKNNAREFNDFALIKMIEGLVAICQDRKEPETFL